MTGKHGKHLSGNGLKSENSREKHPLLWGLQTFLNCDTILQQSLSSLLQKEMLFLHPVTWQTRCQATSLTQLCRRLFPFSISQLYWNTFLPSDSTFKSDLKFLSLNEIVCSFLCFSGNVVPLKSSPAGRQVVRGRPEQPAQSGTQEHGRRQAAAGRAEEEVTARSGGARRRGSERTGGWAAMRPFSGTERTQLRDDVRHAEYLLLFKRAETTRRNKLSPKRQSATGSCRSSYISN